MNMVWFMIALKIATWAALLALIAYLAGWHVDFAQYVLFLLLVAILNTNLVFK